jgi:hypothetical protein
VLFKNSEEKWNIRLKSCIVFLPKKLYMQMGGTEES